MNIGTNIIVAFYLSDNSEVLFQSKHFMEELKIQATVDCKFAFHYVL